MPIVDEIAIFEEQLAELRRLCDEAGRARIPVTVCLWALDEGLMARCADLGVDRLVVIRPDVGDVAAVRSFLDDYAENERRIGSASE